MQRVADIDTRYGPTRVRASTTDCLKIVYLSVNSETAARLLARTKNVRASASENFTRQRHLSTVDCIY